MTTIANLLITPVVSLNNRFKGRFASSALDTPPPPVSNSTQWDFGKYCWKVIVESKDKESGKLDKTFIGYSQEMTIANRTKGGEPELIMKGGECDEVIFMKKTPDGPLIRISNLFF